MRKTGRWLGKILIAALALAALAGLYVALVVAQPQPGEEEIPAQLLLTASPERKISSEAELRDLVRSFPAPVMSLMSGSGMVFVSGESADAPYQGKYGRILTLYWQTPQGEPLMLRSIYPAEALELMGKGSYTFSDTAGPALFGRASVRMESRETVRVHVQMEGTGLYVLTVPRTLETSLSDLSRSVQLFTVE